MTKVSVIIPTYNCGHFLQQALECLCRQTMDDIEFIFIDDGSTDDSWSILLRAKKSDNRIKLLRQEHCGPGCARNKGIEVASGKYIFFMDVGNELIPSCIETLYEQAESTGADLVGCAGKLYHEELKLVQPMKSTARMDLLTGNRSAFSPIEEKEWLFQILGTYLWNKLFRHSLFFDNRIRFAETYIFEYLKVVVLSYVCSKKVSVVDQEMVTFRFECSKITTARFERHMDDFEKVLEYIFDNIINEYPIYETTFLKYLTACIYELLNNLNEERPFQYIYDYAKAKICGRIADFSENDFLDIAHYLTWKVLNGSVSSLDFILSKRTVQSYSPADWDCKIYKFPFEFIPFGKRILLCGNDDICRDLYLQAVQTHWCEKVFWVDTTAEKYQYRDLPVIDICKLSKVECDFIIACMDNNGEKERGLEELGRSDGIREKIIYYSPKIDDKEALMCNIISRMDVSNRTGRNSR